MRKLLLVTLLSLTTLSGCLSMQPKSYEGKGYSVAKQKLVSLGAPQDYITDGKTPLEAKFEGQSRMDAISRHAGLATAVSTLSITSTFMATMVSSDVDERTAWKRTLSNPLVFIESESGVNSKEIKRMASEFFIKKGFSYNDFSGLFEKNDTTYHFGVGPEMKTTENGKVKTYQYLSFRDGQKSHYDIMKEFYYSSGIVGLQMYVPASNGEPAYIIDKGQKHYFVSQK